MPLHEIPRHLSPEAQRLVESALEEAWQEVRNGLCLDPVPIKAKLRRTIVALASVGETDPRKLKWFSIHAWRGAMQAAQAENRQQMKAA